MVSPTTARVFGFHVNELVHFGIYTNAQANLPAFGTAAVTPYRRFTARLVGIVVQATSVVEDDTDAGNNANVLVFTPALTKPLLHCCVYFSAAALKVSGGSQNVVAVQRQIARILPRGFGPFAANSVPAIEAKAERAIKPESIALGVFGGICALAALLIAAQMIGRQLRLGVDDLDVLRALLSAHGVEAGHQIVLGAITLGQLHKRGHGVGQQRIAGGPIPDRRYGHHAHHRWGTGQSASGDGDRGPAVVGGLLVGRRRGGLPEPSRVRPRALRHSVAHERWSHGLSPALPPADRQSHQHSCRQWRRGPVGAATG